MDSKLSTYNKNFTRNGGELTGVSYNLEAGPKVICSNHHRNLEMFAKITDGFIARLRLVVLRPTVLHKGQYGESTKGLLLSFCSADSTNNSWDIPWNVTAFCTMFKTSHQTRKLPTGRGWRTFQWANRTFRIENILGHHQKDQLMLHQFGKEALLHFFFGCAPYAVRH